MSVLQCKEIGGIATLKRGILATAECGFLVGIEEGHGTSVTTIEIVVELDELLQLVVVGYFLYVNHDAKVNKKGESTKLPTFFLSVK